MVLAFINMLTQIQQTFVGNKYRAHAEELWDRASMTGRLQQRDFPLDVIVATTTFLPVTEACIDSAYEEHGRKENETRSTNWCFSEAVTQKSIPDDYITE